jgi:hypothetical protein
MRWKDFISTSRYEVEMLYPADHEKKDGEKFGRMVGRYYLCGVKGMMFRRWKKKLIKGLDI